MTVTMEELAALPPGSVIVVALEDDVRIAYLRVDAGWVNEAWHRAPRSSSWFDAECLMDQVELLFTPGGEQE